MAGPDLQIVREIQGKAEEAQQQANQVEVPLTRRLGLVDFVKQLFREAGEDHLGTLAGLAILLLFMYYSAYILLLGAEVNQVIEEHAPGGKQEGEREPSPTSASEDGHLVKETRKTR